MVVLTANMVLKPSLRSIYLSLLYRRQVKKRDVGSAALQRVLPENRLPKLSESNLI